MKFRTTHIIFALVQGLTIWLFFGDFIEAARTGVFPTALPVDRIPLLVFERKETMSLSRSPAEYFRYSDGAIEYASQAPISTGSQYRFVSKQTPKGEVRLLLPLDLGTLFFFRALGFFVIVMVTGTIIYGISIKLQGGANKS